MGRRAVRNAPDAFSDMLEEILEPSSSEGEDMDKDVREKGGTLPTFKYLQLHQHCKTDCLRARGGWDQLVFCALGTRDGGRAISCRGGGDNYKSCIGRPRCREHVERRSERCASCPNYLFHFALDALSAIFKLRSSRRWLAPSAEENAVFPLSSFPFTLTVNSEFTENGLRSNSGRVH